MPYRHLSLCEREIIATRHAQGHSLSQIARLLKRHASTISREIRRHRQPHGYAPQVAEHQQIAKILRLKTFFADPYSPWQRGTNEQINGLIRRYFPKGTDFSKVSNQRLDEGVLKINQRSRKCLGCRTPYDVFADALRVALAT